MRARVWLVLLLNGALMVAIAQRHVTLREAWRSHNMAMAAWEALERDQLGRGTEIFGPAFILQPRGPTSTPGP